MNGEIISNNDSAMDIKEIRIKLDKPIRFIPGQYVMVAFEDKTKDRRAYSILSYDFESNIITLLVKVAGEFTKKLMHSKPQNKVFVYGPYGKFTLKKKHDINETQTKNIFIAGGIGIVPLYSIMQELINNSEASTYLFYSCRYYHEMALYNELKELKQNSDSSQDSNLNNMHINFYFTREGNMDRFNVEEIKLIPDFKEYNYYICGPDKMMGHIVNALKSIGVDENNIYTESFTLDSM